MTGETYAGQNEEQNHEQFYISPEFEKQFSGRSYDQRPLSGIEVAALKKLSNDGSWFAGNVLHLSGVGTPDKVGGEKYEYRQATFHKPKAKLIKLKPSSVKPDTELTPKPFSTRKLNIFAEYDRPDRDES